MASSASSKILTLDEKMLQQRLRDCRTYLVRNMKVFDLIMKPCLHDIIPKTEEIMRLERQDQITEAAGMFLDAFLNSMKPYKWDKLKEALLDPQHALVVDILRRGETDELKEHDKLQRKLEKFKQDIMETIDPFMTCMRLQKHELLSEAEVEKVQACYKQDASQRANYLILLYVPRNKSWFRKFMEILWEMEHYRLVKRVDEYIFRDLENSLGFSDTISQGTNAISQVGVTSSIAAPSVTSVLQLGCGNLDLEIATKLTLMQNSDDGPIANRTRSRTLQQNQASVQENNLKQILSAPPKTNDKPERSLPKSIGFTSKAVEQIKETMSDSSITRSETFLPITYKSKCKNCLKSFVSNDDLRIHQKNGCKTEPRYSYSPDVSIETRQTPQQTVTTKSKAYGSGLIPSTEVNDTRYNNNSDSSETKVECDLCRQLFQNERGMKIHKTKMHVSNVSGHLSHSQESDDVVSVRSYNSEKNGKFSSDIKKTLSKEQRTRKTDLCDKEAKVKATRPSFVLNSGESLRTSSSEEGFICNICKRSFTTEGGMKQHKTKMHSQENRQRMK